MDVKGLRRILPFGVLLLPVPGFADDSGDVGEVVVTGRRLPPAASELVLATSVIDRETLAQSGNQRLDDALRDVPGFSLFRRQSSRASHPTTQGVTLRGLGPSGAGRTLVLLDGVPQNDPFGGWIDWSRLPTTTLESVSLTRGGGAGPWGNAALAGTLRLRSHAPAGNGVEGKASVDSFGAVDGTISGFGALGKANLMATVAGHSGKGPYLIREGQRGPADVRTRDKGGLIQGGVGVPFDDATQVSLTGAYSSDVFINGIEIAKSRSRIADGTANIVHDNGRDAVGWEAHVYVRDENLPAVFSSVNATRTTVTPSLNQFRVPATAVGGNAIVRVPVSDALAFDIGADGRRTTGETNELFQYVAPAFTRVRAAGGAQFIGGGYLEANWTPTAAITVTAAGRVDTWEQTDGHRRETAITGGALLRDDRYAKRSGTVGNYRLGGRVAATETVELRATVYSGFRVPTLNELYRPFRVGNDITEANPLLRPERMRGIEAGIDWKPTERVAASLTLFTARLTDAVGNITVRTTPGLDPVLNVVVPAGGTLRQRQNIDRIHSEGVEADVTVAATSALDLTVRYLYTAPRITKASNQPSLVGLDLAQVAKHQGFVSASWRPWSGGVLRAEGHFAGSQFEDDINSRRLAGTATLDLYAEQALSPSATLFLSADNLFDRTVEAGRSADGLVTVGTPRVVAAGVKFRL